MWAWSTHTHTHTHTPHTNTPTHTHTHTPQHTPHTHTHSLLWGCSHMKPLDSYQTIADMFTWRKVWCSNADFPNSFGGPVVGQLEADGALELLGSWHTHTHINHQYYWHSDCHQPQTRVFAESYLSWPDLDVEVTAFVGDIEDFGPSKAVYPQTILIDKQTRLHTLPAWYPLPQSPGKREDITLQFQLRSAHTQTHLCFTSGVDQ